MSSLNRRGIEGAPRSRRGGNPEHGHQPILQEINYGVGAGVTERAIVAVLTTVLFEARVPVTLMM